LGHSRGAIIGALLAAVAPERISTLGLIEGLWAQTNPAEQTVMQMVNSLRAERRQRPDKAYATLDEMVSLRCANGFGLSEPAAREIVLRNASQGAEGHWHWQTDPRHKMPSLMMLTPEQQENCHRAIQAPVELSLAGHGLVLAYPDYAERLLALPHISWSLYEGGHHLHMEGAQSILGPTYNNFFQRL
jgi:pimeloyl-ACP methyl ester carboxylesterase